MNVKLPKNLIIFCWVFFIVAGLSVNITAQEEKSVLNRVQRIEDPELGELIRIAIENINTPETKEISIYPPGNPEYKKLKIIIQSQELEIVRKVTEAYTEIKLLDNQIEQADKRINSQKIPEGLANELLLAKYEMKAKLTNKLAELREIMNIIPIHPLGRKPLEQLNTWIKLDVIGNQVAVFNCSKPFIEYASDMKNNFVKLMSHDEVFNYIKSNVKTLPVRIDILRNAEGIKLSDELNKHIIDFIKDNNLQMQAEVHLDEEIRTRSNTNRLYIQNKRIGSRVVVAVQTATGTIERLDNTIDPNEIENYIQESLISEPSRLPQTILLRHDKESKDMALRIEEKINELAKENGIEKLVTVKMEIYSLKHDR
ncbi:MAG: hypothetical protein JW787_03615 [Sedimentisphaerales bacterium]|nr:hypothetical protein [Sedimentisphaerales bacterium]